MDALQAALPQEITDSFAALPGPQMEEPPELLPLDTPERVVCFRSGGKTYRHIFNRIEPKDWENFFSRVVAETKREKGGFSQVVDTDFASLALYGKAVKRVEGYRTSDGAEVEKIAGWPERIPQHHRLAAVNLLVRVGRSEVADDSILEAEGATVTLDALWNEGEPGEMKLYRGLVHRFASPTAEQRRRFLKAKNRAFVAGGSRSGTTMIPSAHPLLVRLYDELLERAEGYSIDGRAPISREQVLRDMDSVHKASAVVELFPTVLRQDEEVEAAEE